MVRLLGSINRKIVGRANYYRHVVSMKVFDRVDSAIYKRLHRMIKRKHPQKSATWLYQKYYTNRTIRQWMFVAPYTTNSGENRTVWLKSLAILLFVYTGRSCILRLHMIPNGLIISIKKLRSCRSCKVVGSKQFGFMRA